MKLIINKETVEIKITHVNYDNNYKNSGRANINIIGSLSKNYCDYKDGIVIDNNNATKYVMVEFMNSNFNEIIFCVNNQ